MKFDFSEQDLIQIRDRPSTLGHLCGYSKLGPLHDTWIKYLWDSNEPRSIQAHRGAYKTTAISTVGSIRWLLFNPDDRIALIRKPYTEAAKVIRTVKELFKTEPIKALFTFAHKTPPKLLQQKDNSLIFNFKRTKTPEGNLDGYGLDGSYTGTHYDKIQCDDFVTLKDRISKAEREATKERIRELQTNVIDPGKGMGFTGTPWHLHDAWEIVPEPMLYPAEQTGILSFEELEKKRSKTTPALYDCNYNLIHTNSSDAIFSDPDYQDWTVMESVAHLDAKYEGNCTNGFTIMSKKSEDKVQARGWTFEEHIKEKLDWIILQLRRFKVRTIYLEENADKGFLGDLIKDKLREGKINITVKTYHENMHKHTKIVSYLKTYWSNISWAPDTDDNYMAQLLDYRENQKPDDAADSAASLLRQAIYSDSNDTSLWDL